ncbi:MAG: DUF5610 domain-containing protein [Glaciecola sp.]
MNTVQAPANISVNTSKPVPTDEATSKVERAQPTATQAISNDRYSASAANDAVVAKVLSMSINKGVGQSISDQGGSVNSRTLSDKFESANDNDAAIFSIDTVKQNVVGFVSKALSNMAANGVTEDQLSYFKDQAVIGVEVGIDQAKLELVGIADDEIYATIDKTRDAILGGIRELPANPTEYAATIEANKESNRYGFGVVNVTSVNNSQTSIDFNSSAFTSQAQGSNNGRSVYTTNASNISFAVTGTTTSSGEIADLLNKVDSLANTFYRGDIESSYNKAVEQGYTNKEITLLARQLQNAEVGQSALAYDEIQHMNASVLADNSAPKAVAEYLNKYLDVIESSKATLSEEKDFNQIINGIVNQMKDVQVPDLLQAINRFHAFNKNLST